MTPLQSWEREVPRTYRVAELVRDLVRLVPRVPALWAIWVGERLPRALRERVIVAVAQANACRMCEYAHARLALEAGVSEAELAALENLDEEAFDRETWIAIAYARARANANFDPVSDVEEHRSIADAIGQQTRDDVEDVARVMTVANRIANTLNALPARRMGHPIPGSRRRDEVLISTAFLPGAWLGTLVAAARQRKSPFVVWREARSRSLPDGEVPPRRRRWPWVLLSALLVALALLAVGGLRERPERLTPLISMRFPDVEWVDTETLAGWMQGPSPDNPVLLDARRPDEFAVSHLRGARRIDPDRPELDSLDLASDQMVVVYCSVGYRSGAIAEQLTAAGFDEVYNLEGGIFAWANEDRPIVRYDSPTTVVHPYDDFWGSFLRRDLQAK